MDDSLRRTMRGKMYKVKGYVKVPFNRYIKAIDEDDAEELIYNIVDEEEIYSIDGVEVIIEEVIEDE